jgi:hypothetical protein
MTFSCGRGVGSAPKILHTSDDTPIVGVPPALCRMSCPEVRGALAEGTVTLSIERALRSLHPCCRASEPLRASRVGTSPRGLGLSAARLHTHEAPADYPLSLSRTIRRARWLIFPTLRSATQVAFNPFSVSGSRCDPRAFEAMPRRAGDTSGERCRPGGAPCLWRSPPGRPKGSPRCLLRRTRCFRLADPSGGLFLCFLQSRRRD